MKQFSYPALLKRLTARGALLLCGLSALQAEAVCTSASRDLGTNYSSGQVFNFDQSSAAWSALAPMPSDGSSPGVHRFSCTQVGEAPVGSLIRIDTVVTLPSVQLINYAGRSYRAYAIPGNNYFAVIVRQTDGGGFMNPVDTATGTTRGGNTNNILYDAATVSGGVIRPTVGTIVSRGAIVPPGTYSIPRFAFGTARAYRNGTEVSGAGSSAFFPALTIVVRTKTCSISAPSVVTLPTTDTQDFAGVGSLSRITESVPVTVNCAASPGFASTQVSAVFTDARTAANRTNRLTRAAADTSNVQIALYRGNTQTPLNFGPDSSAVGTTNSFVVGTVSGAGGTLSIPLIAGYIATASSSTAGKTSGMATMTLIYQ